MYKTIFEFYFLNMKLFKTFVKLFNYILKVSATETAPFLRPEYGILENDICSSLFGHSYGFTMWIWQLKTSLFFFFYV